MAIAPAHALTYAWSYTSANDSGGGQFTTAGPLTSTIIGFNGTFDGNPLLSLSTYGASDNKLYAAAPYVSVAGISFTTVLDTYNIYSNFGASPVRMCQQSVTTACPSGSGDVGTFTLTSVPEPASWAMLIAGFAMVGFAARRRSAALAA